jgi:TRAP-type C4-dicarboxylate transport system permease large subunit
MELGVWTVIVGAAVGVALALFGAKMLVTGRAPAGTAKAFRQIKDAGLYHLLFGLGLLVLVVGLYLPGGATATVSAAVAVVLAGVAVVRYRPRGRRSEGEQRQ